MLYADFLRIVVDAALHSLYPSFSVIEQALQIHFIMPCTLQLYFEAMILVCQQAYLGH
jgi:hypothetical protein